MAGENGRGAGAGGSPTVRRNLLSSLVLAALVLIVYAQTLRFPFVSLDDPVNVTEQPIVQRGLSWAGLRWSFTTTAGGYWHPLIWLSWMLDAQIFGVRAHGFHLTNLVLHCLNAVLLYWILAGMTEAFVPSLFVAAIFAVHPLHVESVAWITERKDLLSTLLLFATLLTHHAFVKRPSWRRHLAVACVYGLGLLAKPMLVTLPFLLLLLDYWPLARFRPPGSLRALVVEKLPLFGLAAACAAVTLFTHLGEHAVMPLRILPPALRAANVISSYGDYLVKTVWPVDLAVYYPILPERLTLARVGPVGLLLLTVSVLAVLARRRLPYLFVGWFWYLLTLLPVIGIVQAGAQSMADRFSYVPMVGLTIAVAWGALEWARLRGRLAIPLIAASAAACAVLTALAFRQVGYWRSSEALFEHALAVTGENGMMHLALGNLLHDEGRLAEAEKQFVEAASILPENHVPRLNLGVTLLDLGRPAEAAAALREAIRVDPMAMRARVLLAESLVQLGRTPEAVAELEGVLHVDPDSPEALNMLAWIRATSAVPGQRDCAQALALSDRLIGGAGGETAAFLDTLAAAYAACGRFADAVRTEERSIEGARRSGDAKAAGEYGPRLQRYRAGLPFIDVVPPGAGAGGGSGAGAPAGVTPGPSGPSRPRERLAPEPGSP